MGEGDVARWPDWGDLPRGSPLQASGTGEGPRVFLDLLEFCSCWNQQAQSCWYGQGNCEQEPESCLVWG